MLNVCENGVFGGHGFPLARRLRGNDSCVEGRAGEALKPGDLVIYVAEKDKPRAAIVPTK